MTSNELVRRAQIFLDQGDFEECEALARRALMMNPDSSEARHVLANALIEQQRYEEAVTCLEQVVERLPDDPVSLADLGFCLYEMCRFDEAESVLGRALEIDPDDPHANYWMGLCVERRGFVDLADEYFERAHERDADAFPRPHRLAMADFEKAVREAVGRLPRRFQRELTNLEIIVEDLPAEEQLWEFDPPLEPSIFGLYWGTPRTERGTGDVPQLPDMIYIYKRNLERLCEDRDALVEEIRITVLHEIGHYLGLDEADLEASGYA